jgi:hypothetical protein
MTKVHRKAAPERAQNSNRNHRGVPKVAAELAGCHVSMVYKVLNGQATSAKVSKAIASAEVALGYKRRRVA